MKIDTLKLSELFIKEPSTLELLLYLYDNYNINTEECYENLREIDPKLDAKNLIKELNETKVINIENNKISLTEDGKYVIKKLRNLYHQNKEAKKKE